MKVELDGYVLSIDHAGSLEIGVPWMTVKAMTGDITMRSWKMQMDVSAPAAFRIDQRVKVTVEVQEA